MNPDLLLVFGGLLLFGLLISYAVQYSKNKEEQRGQIIQSLGFTPLEVSATLTERINNFYNWDESKPKVALNNISRKMLPDGEMYLFDMEDSDTEKQNIAFLSPELALSQFWIFPRIEIGNTTGKLMNKALVWVISKIKTPIDFSEVPEFQKHYIVCSSDPDSTRRFLDANLLQ